MIKQNPKETELNKANELIMFLESFDGYIAEDGKKIPGSKAAIQAYKQWLRFPKEKQERIAHEWNEYYSRVRESDIYKLFLQQKKAMLGNNLGRVKEISDEISDLPRKIARPEFYDPELMLANQYVAKYRFAASEVNRLKDELYIENIAATII